MEIMVVFKTPLPAGEGWQNLFLMVGTEKDVLPIPNEGDVVVREQNGSCAKEPPTWLVHKRAYIYKPDATCVQVYLIPRDGPDDGDGISVTDNVVPLPLLKRVA